MKLLVALTLALLAAASAPAQPRDEARPSDLQQLQDDLENLDDALKGLEPGDQRAEEFRRRAEEIREDTVYLKVKMRRHERGSREGTGVSHQEVQEVRRSVQDLLADIDRSFGGGAREARLPEGTEIVLRLDDSLSSKTARREDRFDATVLRAVRARERDRVAIPAGARVRGIVRDVERAQRPSKAGRLDLDFDTLYLDRERLDLRARVVSISEDDRKEGPSTAGKAGIGATLGAILGGVLGGSKGAMIGILVGGTGAVAGTKGEEVELPAGTVVRIRLERPLMLSSS
jgi:cytochrome c556